MNITAGPDLSLLDHHHGHAPTGEVERDFIDLAEGRTHVQFAVDLDVFQHRQRRQAFGHIVAVLELLQRAAQTAYEAATHAENIAENKYDTLGLEASYLSPVCTTSILTQSRSTCLIA